MTQPLPHGDNDSSTGRQPARSTDASPRSRRKVDTMSQRRKRGEALFQDDDAALGEREVLMPATTARDQHDEATDQVAGIGHVGAAGDIPELAAGAKRRRKKTRRRRRR